MMAERRRSSRFKPETQLYGKVKASLAARIVDISMHGALLEVPQGLQRRSECRLSIPLPGGELQVRAIVKRCSLAGLREATPEERASLARKPGEGEKISVYRAGLEFVDLPAEQFALLQRHYGLAPKKGGGTESKPLTGTQELMSELKDVGIHIELG